MPLFSSTFTAQVATGTVDLFQLTAGAGRTPKIAGWEVGQSSDAGDAEDEQLRLELVFGHTTTGTSGIYAPTAFPTATAMVPSGTRPQSTIAQFNTSIASAGAPAVKHATAFNVRAGHIWLPPPELRPQLGGSEIAALRLNSTPADPITISGTFYFEE